MVAKMYRVNGGVPTFGLCFWGICSGPLMLRKLQWQLFKPEACVGLRSVSHKDFCLWPTAKQFPAENAARFYLGAKKGFLPDVVAKGCR